MRDELARLMEDALWRESEPAGVTVERRGGVERESEGAGATVEVPAVAARGLEDSVEEDEGRELKGGGRKLERETGTETEEKGKGTAERMRVLEEEKARLEKERERMQVEISQVPLKP